MRKSIVKLAVLVVMVLSVGEVVRSQGRTKSLFEQLQEIERQKKAEAAARERGAQPTPVQPAFGSTRTAPRFDPNHTTWVGFVPPLGQNNRALPVEIFSPASGAHVGGYYLLSDTHQVLATVTYVIESIGQVDAIRNREFKIMVELTNETPGYNVPSCTFNAAGTFYVNGSPETFLEGFGSGLEVAPGAHKIGYRTIMIRDGATLSVSPGGSIGGRPVSNPSTVGALTSCSQ